MPGVVTLRAAREDDCELVFGWANDPATRTMSFHQTLISHTEHVAWFRASLTSSERRLFVAEDENGPLGFVRFSVYRERPEAAEIGVNLAPERRGQGLSAPVLERASAEARRSGLRRLVARIRPENTASQRAFQRVGYRLSGEEPVGEIVALRYELDLTRNG